MTFWTVSQDHRTLPPPPAHPNPHGQCGQVCRTQRKRGCLSKLSSGAAAKRWNSQKGKQVLSLDGGGRVLCTLLSPTPPNPPPTCQLTQWITRSYGQDYDGAVADLGSASSPTEHGDLLTPRGVWTCRTPERLLPLGGQGEGNTCSGTRSFLDFQRCLHTNSHLNFTKKFVPLA